MGHGGLLQGGEAELAGDSGTLGSGHFSTSATFCSSFSGHFPLTYFQLLLLLVRDYEEGTLCHLVGSFSVPGLTFPSLSPARESRPETHDERPYARPSPSLRSSILSRLLPSLPPEGHIAKGEAP